jgi:hypothetical protein
VLEVFRNAAQEALESAITEQLRQHLAAHHPDGLLLRDLAARPSQG